MKLSFGLHLYGAASGASWLAMLEGLPVGLFSKVYVPDHLGGQYSPMLALLSAHHVHPEVTVGTLVLNAWLRHPTVLAKELLTLEALTNGRLVIGIGAGWQQRDFDRLGQVRPPAAERLAYLDEYLTLLELFWACDEVTFHGKWFSIERAPAEPRPRRTHLPLLVGGSSKGILTMAGRRARLVDVDVPQPSGMFRPPEFLAGASEYAFLKRINWVTSAASDVGNTVELQMHFPPGLICVNPSRGEVQRVLSEWGCRRRELFNSPLALVGDLDELAAKVVWWAEKSGVRNFVFPVESVGNARRIVQAIRRLGN